MCIPIRYAMHWYSFHISYRYTTSFKETFVDGDMKKQIVKNCPFCDPNMLFLLTTYTINKNVFWRKHYLYMYIFLKMLLGIKIPTLSGKSGNEAVDHDTLKVITNKNTTLWVQDHVCFDIITNFVLFFDAIMQYTS